MADSRTGAENVQMELGVSCARKQGMLKKKKVTKMGTQETRVPTERDPNGQCWNNLSNKNKAVLHYKPAVSNKNP